MTLTDRSGLRDVALAVGTALEKHGIEAILTGGACASIHSEGQYSSFDLDFIIRAVVPQSSLDRAMAEAGFSREGDRYVHAASPFWVEFPIGPLAVGGDYKIRPIVLRENGGAIRILSPTDSCRDRLAAFYHWDDRQSLEVAIQIARRQRVNQALIRRWSDEEGFTEMYQEFLTYMRRKKRQ